MARPGARTANKTQANKPQSRKRGKRSEKTSEHSDPEDSLDVLHGELRDVFVSRMIKRLRH